ncbi:DnaJ family domain-containing protein [Neobacillus niacini]|uniref:DnaJ family domain-containing protein n=1 Tax=Neobacillus niacini TaxID=86668 RepID=UPI003983A103
MTTNNGKYDPNKLNQELEEAKKLPGFGKPLPKNLSSGDIYDNFLKAAKEAGYLPPFVALQKEIRQQMDKLLNMIETESKEEDINRLIDEMNNKIKKYNMECPKSMQKMLINLEDIEWHAKIWK